MQRYACIYACQLYARLIDTNASLMAFVSLLVV